MIKRDNTARTAEAMPSLIEYLVVVDFHHSRGPEVECVLPPGADYNTDAWKLLPFQALPDGSHMHTEVFAHFTINGGSTDHTTLFGLSCSRQLDAASLRQESSEVTRSTIQKAVVIVSQMPNIFLQVRDRLGAVTRAYFEQCDFSDHQILVQFFESLRESRLPEPLDRSLYSGISVRQLVHDFGMKVLVLLKALLLELRIIFYGSSIERLCTSQYCLLSLVAGLLENLQQCGNPAADNPRVERARMTSLKSSNRLDLMRFAGLPLELFGQGSFFGPYTPLQQIGLIETSKSYMVGTSNPLFLQAKDQHCDILVDTDSQTLEITNNQYSGALSLTVQDKAWMSYMIELVEASWDAQTPEIPRSRGFESSEEDIRNQFEAYIYRMCAVKRHEQYRHRNGPESGSQGHEVAPTDENSSYGAKFMKLWEESQNFNRWNDRCDVEVFDVIEPRHPCLQGGSSLQDLQARVAVSIAELNLREKSAQTRAAIGRGWVQGTNRFNQLLSDTKIRFDARKSEQTDTDTDTDIAGNTAADQSPSAGIAVDARAFLSNTKDRVFRGWTQFTLRTQQEAHDSSKARDGDQTPDSAPTPTDRPLA